MLESAWSTKHNGCFIDSILKVEYVTPRLSHNWASFSTWDPCRSQNWQRKQSNTNWTSASNADMQACQDDDSEEQNQVGRSARSNWMLNQRADDGVAAQPDGHHQPPIPAEFSSAQASAAANSSGASAKHKGTPDPLWVEEWTPPPPAVFAAFANSK